MLNKYLSSITKFNNRNNSTSFTSLSTRSISRGLKYSYIDKINRNQTRCYVIRLIRWQRELFVNNIIVKNVRSIDKLFQRNITRSLLFPVFPQLPTSLFYFLWRHFFTLYTLIQNLHRTRQWIADNSVSVVRITTAVRATVHIEL